ncbi:hypothetical protein L9F63_013870, partial [Diploptera punctata]
QSDNVLQRTVIQYYPGTNINTIFELALPTNLKANLTQFNQTKTIEKGAQIINLNLVLIRCQGAVPGSRCISQKTYVEHDKFLSFNPLLSIKITHQLC